MSTQPEKTRTGQTLPMPPELKKWNWGAFLLSWVWGIGNNTYIALFGLIPYVGLVVRVILGFKGNEWAWKNKQWDSVEHFQKVQRRWVKWGIAVWAICAVLGVLFVYFVLTLLRGDHVFKVSLHLIQKDQEITAAIGQPIQTGFVFSGDVHTKGSTGEAKISYPIKGPRGSGQAEVEASQSAGEWKFTRIRVHLKKSKQTIEVAPPRSGDT